jgi:ABC-type amino acid transport system permease subunit
MTAHRTDPLLLAGKVLTLIMQGGMAIGALVLILILPLFLLAPTDLIKGFADGSQAQVEGLPIATLGALLLIGLGIAAAMFVFFGKLRAIIDTVGDGDPFIPENARRLNIMAWLLLGVQLATIPALILAAKIADAAGELDTIKISIANDGLDFTGILVVLILFILARVFRIGAALRDDLEGTV